MKMFTCKFAQDEVTHQSLRVGSKNPSGKAAAIFTRGAYAYYVSTGKWRERRWRLFSTDPKNKLWNLVQALQEFLTVR